MQVEKQLVECMRNMPMTAKTLGIRMEKDTPDADDLSRVAKEKLFVRIKPVDK